MPPLWLTMACSHYRYTSESLQAVSSESTQKCKNMLFLTSQTVLSGDCRTRIRRRKQLPMGSCSSKEIEGGTRKIQQDAKRQAALLRKQAEATALKAAQDEERRAKVARMKEFTVVLLDLNGNPGQTFQLKWDLQEQLQALQEYICGLDSLPDSWNRKYLRKSDLVLSIGDAAISDGMSLRQNGQCCVSDGCDPLSLSARV